MTSDNQKILLSGIQPSGDLHIGNYFGAIKQFVEMQEEYETYISIVNYHAMTTVHDGDRLKELTYNAVVDHLAAGLDPAKATIFLQSDLPEVTELAWIFETLVTTAYLERAHAYKDKVAKGIEATAGLFNYPALMAADILIMNADVVPVGADQKQHVEYARDIAEKFNSVYGETFKLAEPIIKKEVATVPGIDGQKMSKSYNNTIPLFAEDEEIEKLVMSIPTDSKNVEESKNPEEDNVFKLHKLFAKGEELAKIREGYEKGGLSYVEYKKILIANIQKFIRPLREKRKEIFKDKEQVMEVLAMGAQKTRESALPIMAEVRKRVGLLNNI
jgi:tryptophanyl-tRNA synthetase